MTHQDRWFAILNDGQKISQQVRHLVTEGRASEIEPPPDSEGFEYRYILGTEHPFTAAALIRLGKPSSRMVAAFPVVNDLADNELEILSTEPLPSDEAAEADGIVTAITKEGTEVSFHCPIWLAMRSTFEAGGRYIFGLGAVALSLEVPAAEIVMTKGSLFEMEKRQRMAEDPLFDPASFTAMTIAVGKARTLLFRKSGNFEFESIVESISSFSGLGTTGRILLLNLAPEERQPIMVKMYATVEVLNGYEPAVGDSVVGIAWMQGMLLEEVVSDSSWLDSAEAAHGDGNSGLMAMASFTLGNHHLPLAVRAVGGAALGAGWGLKAIEDRLFGDWPPAIIAERRDETFWLFVRTAIKGVHEAPPFGGDRENLLTYTRQHNIRCLWLTVTLEARGEKYALSAEGLEEFSEELQLPLELTQPEHFKVLSIDPPAEPPESTFDEANAAAIFAEGINQMALAPLSKLLVEDLRFSSQTANLSLCGRQTFLSYLGRKLQYWKEEGKPISAKTGTATHDGMVRPCAIGFDFEGRPITCTLFTGRQAHIAAIEVLPASAANLH